MNDLKGIIEDCNKSDLVSNKVIKKVREIIGQEEWNDLYDENSDICTTMGELIITLKGIPDLEKENEELKSDIGTMIPLLEKAKDMSKRLSKAKEIIKLLLWDLRNRSYEPVKDIEQAEQFLKECE